MELDAEDRSRAMTHSRHLHGGASRGHLVARWRCLDMVAMAHPHRDALAFVESTEQPVRSEDLELRASVLARTRCDLSALNVRDDVHAVADTENRCDVEQRRIRARSVVIVYGAGATTQDDASRLPLPDPLDGARWRMNLGVHTSFTDTPRDQLGELRAVVETQNPAAHDGSTRVHRAGALRATCYRGRGSRRWEVRRATRTPHPD